LAPGAGLPSANEEAQAIHERYKREHPRAPDGSTDSRLAVTPLQESFTVGIRPTLKILAYTVGCVLLIGCANVAALLLARASARSREIAVRAALGASRWQLVAHFLWESVLLSAAGAAIGAVLANWGLQALVKADAGQNVPGFQPIGTDWRVLAFTTAVSLLTAVIFGLLPALHASRPDINSVLRDAGRGSIGTRRRPLRSLLVIAQIGVSMALLIAAGLLMASFRQVRNLQLGFDAGHTLTARVSLPPAQYPDGPRRQEFVHDLLGKLAALPGVSAAAVSRAVPVTSSVLSPVLAEGQPFVPLGQRPVAQWNGAAPGYFHTLGIPLLAGRDFTWEDDEKSPRVVIVNQALTRHFWAGENPLGKHVTFTRLQVPFEVVGVVGDTRNGALEAAPPMTVYSAYGQWTFQRVTIALRTAGNPTSLAHAVAEQVAAVDRNLALVDTETMDDLVADAMLQRRETLYLIAGFAALALLMAVIGLYGAIAYSVSQRTAEMAIRQAIGAQPADILSMVVGQGLRLTGAGVVLGVAVAAWLPGLIQSQLFQVSAADPAVFLASAGIFVAVGLMASLVPAWAATRIAPVDALSAR